MSNVPNSNGFLADARAAFDHAIRAHTEWRTLIAADNVDGARRVINAISETIGHLDAARTALIEFVGEGELARREAEASGEHQRFDPDGDR